MVLENIRLESPIHKLRYTDGKNTYYIKREDLLPFSFGGNKVRIAKTFFDDMEKKGCDCMVAYGNSRSNLCRVIANICSSYSIPCFIISPADDSGDRVETYNSSMVNLFGANVITCLKSEVANTVKKVLDECKKNELKPYYTNGDIFGRGNEKTPVQAYVDVYDEILQYEAESGVIFDYIFFASGTGMTQAGLVCGNVLNGNKKTIVGISVARNKDAGIPAIKRHIDAYLETDFSEKDIVFYDECLLGGYGAKNSEIDELSYTILKTAGIQLDPTYTAKAFYGMIKYCSNKQVSDANILFIHTGGTPIFFDNLYSLSSL